MIIYNILPYSMSPSIDTDDIILAIIRLIEIMAKNEKIVYKVPMSHYCDPDTGTIDKFLIYRCVGIIRAYMEQDIRLYPYVNFKIIVMDGVRVQLYRK